MILSPPVKGETIMETLSSLMMIVMTVYVNVHIYYKWIYKNMKQANEPAKEPLKNDVHQLTTEKTHLQESLHQKDIEIEYLLKKNSTLRKNSLKVTLTNRQNKTAIHKQEKFYYNRMGIVGNEQVVNLTHRNAMGVWIEEQHEFNLFSVEQIHQLIPIDVETRSAIADILPHNHITWLTQVHNLAQKQLHQGMN
jgi:hypothetical protein